MNADTSQSYEPDQNAAAPANPAEEGDVTPWQRAPTTPRAASGWDPSLPSVAAGMPTQPRRRDTPWFPWLVGGCLGVLVVLILFCAVVAGTLGGLAFRIANRQEAEEKLSQTASVSGIPVISIESDVGAVRVVAGPDNQVHLAATKTARAGSEEDARHQLQRATVLMRQDGNTIAITSRTTGSNGFGVSLTTDLTVTVPHQTLLSLHLQSGNAAVEGVTLSGSCVLEIQRGDVSLAGSLDPAAAVMLHVAAGNATVSLPQTNAIHVDAATLRGAVSVKGLSANTQHSGDGASLVADTRSLLAVSPASGATLSIRVDSGDIVLSFT